MRIIDADALHDTILRDEKLDGKDVNWAVNRIISHILNAPTIDTTFKEVVAYECGQKSVEERPKGKWLKSSNMSKRSYQRLCSNCKHIVYFCGDGNYPNCPYCLADMKGEENG